MWTYFNPLHTEMLNFLTFLIQLPFIILILGFKNNGENIIVPFFLTDSKCLLNCFLNFPSDWHRKMFQDWDYIVFRISIHVKFFCSHIFNSIIDNYMLLKKTCTVFQKLTEITALSYSSYHTIKHLQLFIKQMLLAKVTHNWENRVCQSLQQLGWRTSLKAPQ